MVWGCVKTQRQKTRVMGLLLIDFLRTSSTASSLSLFEVISSPLSCPEPFAADAGPIAIACDGCTELTELTQLAC